MVSARSVHLLPALFVITVCSQSAACGGASPPSETDQAHIVKETQHDADDLTGSVGRPYSFHLRLGIDRGSRRDANRVAGSVR